MWVSEIFNKSAVARKVQSNYKNCLLLFPKILPSCLEIYWFCLWQNLEVCFPNVNFVVCLDYLNVDHPLVHSLAFDSQHLDVAHTIQSSVHNIDIHVGHNLKFCWKACHFCTQSKLLCIFLKKQPSPFKNCVNLIPYKHDT